VKARIRMTVVNRGSCPLGAVRGVQAVSIQFTALVSELTVARTPGTGEQVSRSGGLGNHDVGDEYPGRRAGGPVKTGGTRLNSVV
jgi:hypothetical protein